MEKWIGTDRKLNNHPQLTYSIPVLAFDERRKFCSGSAPLQNLNLAVPNNQPSDAAQLSHLAERDFSHLPATCSLSA